MLAADAKLGFCGAVPGFMPELGKSLCSVVVSDVPSGPCKPQACLEEAAWCWGSPACARRLPGVPLLPVQCHHVGGVLLLLGLPRLPLTPSMGGPCLINGFLP